MGKIDKEKEQISWIKFWIGVGVASIMGLISYFVNHYDKVNEIILVITIVAVVMVAIFVVLLNNIGLKKIKDLEKL